MTIELTDVEVQILRSMIETGLEQLNHVEFGYGDLEVARLTYDTLSDINLKLGGENGKQSNPAQHIS